MSRLESSSVKAPVVILGMNEMALAAARNLHSHGIEVTAIQLGQAARPPISHSRSFRYLRGPAADDEQGLLEFLARLAAGAPEKPVLLPVQDQLLLFVDARREELGRHYRFFVWDSALLATIGSKAGLAAIAGEYGLPTPRSGSPETAADIDGIAQTLRYPCIVKPEFTNDWWTPEAKRAGLSQKAIEVANAGELRDVCTRSAGIGARAVVQEKIVGPDAAHMSYMAFVPDTGEPVGEIVVVKHRIYPPRFGVACFAEATLTEDAIETGRDVLRRLGYRGFVSVQLKRDERDGKLYLIEINLRLPLAVQLPISAGAEFPWYYYLASAGQPIEDGRVRVGRRWMAFGRDFRSMKTYARDGTHSWFGWVLDLARMPVFAILSFSDPMPTVAGVADSIGSALRRRFGKSGKPRVGSSRRATGKV